MDDECTMTNLATNTMESTSQTRDENRSPTSGSSSETHGEERHYKKDSNRKHRRHPQRKRKWKPYTDLSWDERKKQDDRESRRAFAKRERLSAEGHPIAPYNTTQFLMEDDHRSSPVHDAGRKLVANDSSVSLQSMDVETTPKPTDGTTLLEPKRARFCVDSPHPDSQNQSERGTETRDDIQRYILNDFSQTYAGIHAEELQSMSKMDLIAECLKLEKKVRPYLTAVSRRYSCYISNFDYSVYGLFSRHL